MRAFSWIVAGVIGVTGAALAAELHDGPPQATPVRPATPPRVTVTMTAATLADDCGGGAPVPAPPKKSDRQDSSARHGARARRACEQTSMQLAIVAPVGVAATSLRVKSVELFDENDVRVGKLTPRAPTRWSATRGTYEAWNESIAPTESLSVSYALSQPDWAAVTERWNKTFTVKAVITVGGSDQTVEHDVFVAAETSLPPNVRT